MLTSFDIDKSFVSATFSEANADAGIIINTDYSFEFENDDTQYYGLTIVPIRYRVTNNGVTYESRSKGYGDYDGYLYELKILFYIVNEENEDGTVQSSLCIHKINDYSGYDDYNGPEDRYPDIEPGVYDIEIIVPTTGGSVHRYLTLKVREDAAEGAPPACNITEYVRGSNSLILSADLGCMVNAGTTVYAATYEGNMLKSVTPVTANGNKIENAVVPVPEGTGTIKLFVWDGCTPLCLNAEEKITPSLK